MMGEKERYPFTQHMLVYENKFFLVRNLYWNRIKTALEFAQIKDTSILLDIGCSRGHLLTAIRKSNKNCECWGIDIEPKIVNLQIDDCKLRVADVKNLPFEDNHFDVVFTLSTMEHIRNLDDAIKQILRVLKPGGVFILSSPTESWFYRFCRFLLTGTLENDVQIGTSKPRREADHHYHNVYEIEKKIKEYGFIQIQQKSFPSFPFPELHRVTKFKKPGV